MQGVVICLWLRHPCVRAARLQGLWNSGQDGGGYRHHAAEHWRWRHPEVIGPHPWFTRHHQATPASAFLNLNEFLCLLSAAMSSYLYIVKYEFPLVIVAFLKVDNPAGWGRNTRHKHAVYPLETRVTCAGQINWIYLVGDSSPNISCLQISELLIQLKNPNKVWKLHPDSRGPAAAVSCVKRVPVEIWLPGAAGV